MSVRARLLLAASACLPLWSAATVGVAATASPPEAFGGPEGTYNVIVPDGWSTSPAWGMGDVVLKGPVGDRQGSIMLGLSPPRGSLNDEMLAHSQGEPVTNRRTFKRDGVNCVSAEWLDESTREREIDLYCSIAVKTAIGVRRETFFIHAYAAKLATGSVVPVFASVLATLKWGSNVSH